MLTVDASTAMTPCELHASGSVTCSSSLALLWLICVCVAAGWSSAALMTTRRRCAVRRLGAAAQRSAATPTARPAMPTPHAEQQKHSTTHTKTKRTMGLRGCATAVQSALAACFSLRWVQRIRCLNFNRAQLTQLQRYKDKLLAAGDKLNYKCVCQVTDQFLLITVRWEEQCKHICIQSSRSIYLHHHDTFDHENRAAGTYATLACSHKMTRHSDEKSDCGKAETGQARSERVDAQGRRN